jgi:succinate dehydrogenase/fumarate reductase iron-sulfur protein
VSQVRWNIQIVVSRYKQGGKPYDQAFSAAVDPQENVLDVIERIWAFQDRSLVFRHACHHSTCGACGMRVNGVEKLTCITPVQDVVKDGGVLKIEPLRNFPIQSDLVVDMSAFYQNLEKAGGEQVIPVKGSTLPYEHPSFPEDGLAHERLADCIECGLCVSACPIALTTPAYFGPAALAAAQQAQTIAPRPALMDWADSANGVWRCHSGFECTAVCPSNVDPAWRIMDLRRRVIRRRIRQLFGIEKE